MKNNEYNLTYNEAVEKLMNKEGFIQGENFAKGYYVALDDMDIAYMYDANDMCRKYNTFFLCSSSYNQKYRVIITANEARFK